MSSLHRCSCAFALALLVLDFAGVAEAHTVMVDPAGGGDFVTIQAALNSVAASFAPETVLVRAGAYAETIALPNRDSQSLLLCPAGAESTSVAGLTFATTTWGVASAHRDWVVRGLTVSANVTSVPQKSRARFEQCAFASGLTVNWLEGGVSMPVADCDFGGPTQLLGIYGIAQSLRFRNAPLRTEPRVGGLYYTDCAFVGAPGETLVVAPRTEDLGFTRCTFDSAGVGVWFANGGFTGLSMNRCRFRRLALAVGEPVLFPETVGFTNRRLGLFDSDWSDCDRAVSWPGGALTMERDTLRRCGDGAVTARVEAGAFTRLLVEDNFGAALDVQTARFSEQASPYADVWLSEFRRIGGVGVRLRHAGPFAEGSVSLSSCRFERCEVGAELADLTSAATRCTFFASTRQGLSVTSPDGFGVGVSYCSFVACGAEGFELRADPSGRATAADITHNLAAHNGGAGLRFVGTWPSGFFRNDSWLNSGGDFVGVTPDTSNFSLDPRFCGIASGDLTLSSDSPCASGDPFDFIGAEGVGCTLAPTGVSPGDGVDVFSAHPNPSRGSVEFALPPAAHGGRLDVLDVQGRVVWSRVVGAGAHALSWSGETAHGPASPGLYWARLTGAGTVQTRTLIRLR